ncbi:MAG: class B sortase [Defluviitaleaceae bacterium]|nr:class B sortase [Defluviitaleaceae bacterium]
MKDISKRKIKVRIMIAILTLSIVSMIGLATALVMELRTDAQGQAFYSEFQIEFMPRPANLYLPSRDTNAVELTAQSMDEEEGFAPFLNFDEMRLSFPNIVGWIQSEGTAINYPIVQGTDNDFYLNHLPDGTRHRLGSIYLDYRNASDFSDTTIFIYGHNTPTGDMFAALHHYARQGHFEAHPTMFIFTPERNLIIELFAGYVLDSAFEVPPMGFLDSDDFYEYIHNIESRSIFTGSISPNFGDQLVFLCTCTNGGPASERLIIVGRLIEI